MKFLPLLLLLFSTVSANNPAGSIEEKTDDTPDLVIGIMIDQFRYDFIYRFWDQYSDEGIKRVLNEGFLFENAHFDYAPTFTGPGHASVYTGTTPSIHGIIENRWFERGNNAMTYVTDDPDVNTLGSQSDEGKMSPRYLRTTTIGDELRLHTNMGSRVVGVSLKDRGAILPAGHTGEAYWLDYQTGNFITSTYYHDQIPRWVQDFNDRKLTDEYLSNEWNLLLHEDEYSLSEAGNPPEAAFPGQVSAGLPHNLPEIAGTTGPGLIAETPYGDKLVLEFAIAAIENESLGKGDFTDLLAISFSAPDHIGHRFGPASREVQDTYIRLDRELGKLLRYLDENFEKENILLFITSDHGAAHVPSYLKERNIPAGYIDESESDEHLREHLKQEFGLDPVASFQRFQVYLDRDAISRAGLSLGEVSEAAARFLPRLDGIAGAITAEDLITMEFTKGIRFRLQNGFFPGRSGDVVYWLDPQWMRTRQSGTTHGSPYSYDTRAPLLWYGGPVAAGRTTYPVFITDIASTLAIFLKTPFPNGNTGNPLNHLMKLKGNEADKPDLSP